MKFMMDDENNCNDGSTLTYHIFGTARGTDVRTHVVYVHFTVLR